jgi:tetratricopeptide (TPR) repeat protein
MQRDQEISDSSLTIAPDSFLLTPAYRNFENFRKFKQRIAEGGQIDPDSLVASNPEFYHAYVLAGDYCYKRGDFNKALHFYQLALTKEIATKKEENYIKGRIGKLTEK